MKKLHSPEADAASTTTNSLGTETGTVTVGRRPGRPAGSANGGTKSVGKISRRSVQKYTDKLSGKSFSFAQEIENNGKIIALYQKALANLKARGQDNPMMQKRIDKIEARNLFLNEEQIALDQMIELQNQILELLPQKSDGGEEEDNDDDDDDLDDELPE